MSFSARSPRSRVAQAIFTGVRSTILVTAVMACSGEAIAAITSDLELGGRQPAPVNPPTPSNPPESRNVLAGASLWVNPASDARRTADAWRSTRPADAAMLDKLAAQGQARWIGNWNPDVQADVDAATTLMTAHGAMPVFVAYNIPQRDCGGLSGGNSTTVDAYRRWIVAFADGVGRRRATVILEPDALAAMDCLSPSDQQLRVDLLRFAVETFRGKGNIAVYIDAGHPAWHSASTMAARLARAGIGSAQGFSLNVSNVRSTGDNLAYGQTISSLTGDKHFVIDTGRNGLGPTPDNQWCNPSGRALGERPTTRTGIANVDAFLWVKTPGESDGACNGAPAAGMWMAEYALGLAQRASY